MDDISIEPDAQRVGALSVDGFCDTYKIGRTTAYGEIKAGRLRALKVGNRTLVLWRDAIAWAEALPTLEAG